MAPIFTVIGATGVQGGSVVDLALKAGTYKVRAVTRNPNSDKGKALAAKGAEVVQADVNDEESLVKAFHVSCPPYFPISISHLTLQQGLNSNLRRDRLLRALCKRRSRGGPES